MLVAENELFPTSKKVAGIRHSMVAAFRILPVPILMVEIEWIISNLLAEKEIYSTSI